MTLPVHQSISTIAVNAANADALTLNMPAGIVAGDLLLAFVGTEDNTAGTTLSTATSGWTKVGEAGDANVDCHCAIWWKEAVGSDAAPVIDFSNTTRGAGYVTRVTGADVTTPINVSSFGGVGSTNVQAVTGVTTDVDDCLVYYFLAFDGGDGYPFSVTGIGWAEIADGQSGTSGNADVSVCIGSRDLFTAGASGTAVVTCSATDGASYFQAAIAPTSGYDDLTAATGSFTISGKPAGRSFGTQSGSLSISGSAAVLGTGVSLKVDTGVFEVSASSAESVDNYYFDASVSGPTDNDAAWTSDANAFDGITTTLSTSSQNGTVDSNELRATGTTAPGSGDSITQVRVRSHAGVYTAINNTIHTVVLYLGTSLGSVSNTSDYQSDDWSSYATLGIPAGGWTWSKLQNLETVWYGTTDGSGYHKEAQKVEIEVTSGGGGGAIEADLVYNRVVAAATGSLTITGDLAELQYIRQLDLSLDTGSYAISSSLVDLKFTQTFETEVGLYSITGVDATFKSSGALATEIGSLTLTGEAASFIGQSTFELDSGSLNILGEPASFKQSSALLTDSGVLAITGTDLGFVSAGGLPTAIGSFILTGDDASFINQKVFEADSGSLSITGEPTSFSLDIVFPVDSGTVNILGDTVGFVSAGGLPTAIGSFTITAAEADITRPSTTILTEAGTLAITSSATEALFARTLDTVEGAYIITESTPSLNASKTISADSGSVAITGDTTAYSLSRVLPADNGEIDVTGYTIIWTYTGGNFLFTEPTLLSLSGASAALKASYFTPTCIDYSFKREAKVYIISEGLRYLMDLSEINFGQTFQEHSYSVKTLQNSYMFEQSVINKANPANFDITFPAIREEDLRILFDRALDYASFDMYIESSRGNFKVENCVITNANFIIEKMRPLSLAIQGEASRVSNTTEALPGTPVPRSPTRTYNRISDLAITLTGAVPINNALASVSIELQNEVQWTPYTNVSGALAATNVWTTMYPAGYTVKKRIVAGSFVKYLVNTEITDLFQWNKNTSLHIYAGQEDSGTYYGFDLDIANCAYTNRIGTGEVFTQSYDWRMTQNPSNLSDVITYTTTPAP